MAIIGAHALLYTTEPEALRATFRDLFGWRHVDAGEGWLIFALPPAELGIHPSEGPTYDSGVRHQLSFMCDDINSTIRDLRAKGIQVKGEPQEESYGITVMLGLPGGVEVMLYEPRHAMAITPTKKTAKRSARRKTSGRKGGARKGKPRAKTRRRK
ncbi:MAG: hypothetical protein L0Y44_09315 [Phycisphaerales bacterium]|nr:hypothetical protein [Phycisphaerales bacterium]MCI0630837.1 hypothetical protein [Phycisphaerales bacterium]